MMSAFTYHSRCLLLTSRTGGWMITLYHMSFILTYASLNGWKRTLFMYVCVLMHNRSTHRWCQAYVFHYIQMALFMDLDPPLVRLWSATGRTIMANMRPRIGLVRSRLPLCLLQAERLPPHHRSQQSKDIHPPCHTLFHLAFSLREIPRVSRSVSVCCFRGDLGLIKSITWEPNCVGKCSHLLAFVELCLRNQGY